MDSQQTKVAANTSWFTIALILQKVLSFVYFTYLARSIGAAALGQYVFALSFIAVFSIVIDFGTNHYLTREVAKDQRQAQSLYGNVMGFKFFSSLLAVIATVSAIHVLGYQPEVISLVYIASVLMVIESLVLSSYAVMRGFHNLRFESVGTILVQFIIAVGGIIALQFTHNLTFLLWLLVGANFLNLIYVSVLLRRRIGLRLRVNIDLGYWRRIFLVILPFTLAAAFTKVYASFDQILLSKLASPEELGFYSVAYKLTFSLQFLPLALVAALYPAMSTYVREDKQLLNKSFTRAVYYLVVLTLPITFSVLMLARDFVLTLYTGHYLDSVLPLQILIVSLVFLFINFPVGSLLNAADKQRRNTVNIALALLVNVVLNIWLIPRWQAVGAAIASTLSTIFLFIVGWQAIHSVVTIDKKFLFGVFLKSIAAAFFMSIVIMLLNPYLYWLWAAGIGLTVYLLAQWLLGTITQRDIRQFIDSIFHRQHVS